MLDGWPSGKAADCRSADPAFESRSVLLSRLIVCSSAVHAFLGAANANGAVRACHSPTEKLSGNWNPVFGPPVRAAPKLDRTEFGQVSPRGTLKPRFAGFSKRLEELLG